MESRDRKDQGGKSEPKILQWDGPTPLPPIPEVNFATFMLKHMESYGDKVAVVSAETHHCRTFAEVCHLVTRVSGGLASAGVSLGQSILFLSPNHLDYISVMLSIVHRGALLVPANPSFSPEDLSHILKVSGSRWAIVYESAVSLAEAAFALLPAGTLRKMWVLGNEAGGPRLDGLLNCDPLTQEEGRVDPARTVAIMPFSSGTTGLPKGIFHSHRNILVPLITAKYKENFLPRVTLMTLPLCHVYGLFCMLITLMFGNTVVLLPRFSPKTLLEAIQNYKVTHLPVAAYIIKHLSETPLLNQYDISSLKVVTSASAPLSPKVVSTFREKIDVEVMSAFGMSETVYFATQTLLPTGHSDISIGKVEPYFEAKVVDVESGETLGAGEDGEFHFRGPSIMLGYTDDSATADTLDADGWLRSGDVGCYDEDGFLFIKDRLKDMIKVKGFQVSPFELEELLRKHPDVADVAVVGMVHDKLGEAPRAYVVPRPGAVIQPRQLQEFLVGRVAPYKELAGGVVIVDSLPRNPTGKILKKKLKGNVKDVPTSKL
ncbi:uncharacterized protein [Panulirus ornatus]